MVLRKFGRRSDHRRAMLRNLVTSMILAGKSKDYGSEGQANSQYYRKNDYPGKA
jgi:ribosomal protein L17